MENKLLLWFSYSSTKNDDNFTDGKMVKQLHESPLKSNSTLLMETLDELIAGYVKNKLPLDKKN
jgi:hypothetical protein